MKSIFKIKGKTNIQYKVYEGLGQKQELNWLKNFAKDGDSFNEDVITCEA